MPDKTMCLPLLDISPLFPFIGDQINVNFLNQDNTEHNRANEAPSQTTEV